MIRVQRHEISAKRGLGEENPDVLSCCWTQLPTISPNKRVVPKQRNAVVNQRTNRVLSGSTRRTSSVEEKNRYSTQKRGPGSSCMLSESLSDIPRALSADLYRDTEEGKTLPCQQLTCVTAAGRKDRPRSQLTHFTPTGLDWVTGGLEPTLGY
ncbi:Uncharacterized protein DAT39_005204 [Clarias magur]|uniref:Uncharacterized protein n=1 Tax=Clarias magur TaxID=1594786 RepID=A0A8J4TWB0_CLAMG|nr:Uncharacterized protein DAT39_005204 [Clarias magur]